LLDVDLVAIQICAAPMAAMTVRPVARRSAGVVGDVDDREFVAAKAGAEVADPDGLRSRAATSFSNSSPMPCPSVSLTFLKPSRSMNNRLIREPNSCENHQRSQLLLEREAIGSPVSVSWCAR